MRTYYPDNWIIVEITANDGDIIRKVLAGWKGAFASPDSWRLSSCISEVIDKDSHYEIHNESGSVYYCPKKDEGFNMIIQQQFRYLQEDLPKLNAKVERVSL
jgi:hypothetical protein